MASLDNASLRSRLAYDARVLRGLRSPHLGAITAYESKSDLQARRPASAQAESAGRATVFTVEYRFQMLTGPSERTDLAIGCFDLLGGGNYPFTAPIVHIGSRPLPWSPHVHPMAGIVCLGTDWSRASGRMLAADLVVHVMRLLNYDEPRPHFGYHGYNATAIAHWRDRLGYQPLHSDLVYPALPEEITHPIRPEPAVFRAATEAISEAFAPIFSASFTPLGGT